MATPSASRTAQATGKGVDTTTSGIEGAWTPTPITWDNSYFDTLFGWEWELTESPAGAKQWKPSNPEAQDIVPDAHDPSRRHAPMMTTADMALRMDPVYEPISRHFHENPAEFADACARAWFKLLHRDMGPVSRYLGPEVPSEELIWQDRVPAVDHALIGDADIAALKQTILDSGLTVSELVSTAWASASTYRTATSAVAPTVPECAWLHRTIWRSTTRRSCAGCWPSSKRSRRAPRIRCRWPT